MTRKRLTAAVAAALAILIAAGVTLLVRNTILKPTTITAYFATATAIYPGDEVRVSGVRVGTVKNIEPQGTKAKITLAVNRDVPIPADAKAIIVAQNLVGARFVQLAPAYETSGPTMRDGAVIDLAGQDLGPRGGVAGGQAQFEPVGDQRGQGREMAKLLLVDLSSLLVDHAERAQVMSVVRGERHTGEEAQAELAADHRLHGRERGARTPSDFGLVEAMVRLEPQPVAVEEADDGNRCIEEIGGQRRDAVERHLGRRIEDLVAPYMRQTMGVIIRSRDGRRSA